MATLLFSDKFTVLMLLTGAELEGNSGDKHPPGNPKHPKHPSTATADNGVAREREDRDTGQL